MFETRTFKTRTIETGTFEIVRPIMAFWCVAHMMLNRQGCCLFAICASLLVFSCTPAQGRSGLDSMREDDEEVVKFAERFSTEGNAWRHCVAQELREYGARAGIWRT